MEDLPFSPPVPELMPAPTEQPGLPSPEISANRPPSTDPAPVEVYHPQFSPALDPAVRRGAAIAILTSTTGLAAGGVIGGPYGAFSGLLLGGAAVNLIRAWRTFRSPDPDLRSEAVKSAIVGVSGLGVAGYLGYLASRRSE
jgi:hypothetical protein